MGVIKKEMRFIDKRKIEVKRPTNFVRNCPCDNKHKQTNKQTPEITQLG